MRSLTQIPFRIAGTTIAMLVAALIPLASACERLPLARTSLSTTSSPNTPTKTPIPSTAVAFPWACGEGLPDFGVTTRTNRYLEIINDEAKEGFLAAYRNGSPGRWQFISYTVEGDPVSYQLCHHDKGREIVFVRDSTKDRFGAKRAVQYRCKELVEADDGLRLLDCRTDNQVEDVRIPTTWGR